VIFHIEGTQLIQCVTHNTKKKKISSNELHLIMRACELCDWRPILMSTHTT
jgi:hypothetical protein